LQTKLKDVMKNSKKPIIGIVMGDAAGIGPEIIIKALLKKEINSLCSPFVIGSQKIMEETAKAIHSKVIFVSLDSPKKEITFTPNSINVLNAEIEKNFNFRWGQVDAINGTNAVAYIKRAVELAMGKEIDGVVIAPLNKESMHKGGLSFPDEATFMAHFTKVKMVKIVVKWNKLFRSTAIGHVPFRQIADLVTKDRIIPVIKILFDTIKQFGITSPRIGVAALNPHGGEDGAFGDEEKKEIKPAVESAQKIGINVSGPFPADTIFARAMKGQFDGVVFLYHDQGNIAMKSAAFGKGVIIYSGLPFLCTSPAHGTAYGKAGEGRADPTSFEEAVKIVVEMNRY